MSRGARWWQAINAVVGIVFMCLAVNPSPPCPEWLWYASAAWAVSTLTALAWSAVEWTR